VKRFPQPTTFVYAKIKASEYCNSQYSSQSKTRQEGKMGYIDDDLVPGEQITFRARTRPTALNFPIDRMTFASSPSKKPSV
jgi:hypothetical protein